MILAPKTDPERVPTWKMMIAFKPRRLVDGRVVWLRYVARRIVVLADGTMVYEYHEPDIYP